MSGLSGESLEYFNDLNKQGQAANKDGGYESGLRYFDEMDQLAQEYDDPLKRMHALNPGAKSLWSMGQYDQAHEKLVIAEEIGIDLKLIDEAAIARSNMGRIAACRIIKTVEVEQQAEALRDEAVPSFVQAYKALKGHPHRYYRYSNAHQGAAVAALAGERRVSAQLITEGLLVAPRRSPPYDEVHTYKINKLGLAQIAAAMFLLPLGPRTPKLADLARSKLVR